MKFLNELLGFVVLVLTGTPGLDGLLTIVKPGEAGGLRIEGFKSGDSGIVIPVPAAITKTDKFGTAGNDLDLAADAPNQKVFGLEGNDRIMAAFAGAEAYGGLGHDYLTNDTGEQRLFYGDATYTLTFNGKPGARGSRYKDQFLTEAA